MSRSALRSDLGNIDRRLFGEKVAGPPEIVVAVALPVDLIAPRQRGSDALESGRFRAASTTIA